MHAQRAALVAWCASAALAATDVPELAALLNDDECDALGDAGDGACGLNTLQLRRSRAARTSGYGIYIERSLVQDEGRELAAYDPMSLQECEAKCDITGGCESFTFGVQDQYKGQCFLKSRVVSPADPEATTEWNRQHFRTYYKAGMLGGGHYIERTLVADEGRSVGDYTDKSPEECAALCDANPSCHSFSLGFGASNGGQCYLKDKWVRANEMETQVDWNREHFRTYYRVGADTQPQPVPADHSSMTKPVPADVVPSKTESKDFLRATSCKPAQVIFSTSMCMQAAEELGISPTRPRVVPPEESTLPPGCLVGPGLRQWPAGMWFNSMGLQKGFFRAESAQPVQGSDGFELLCKREPYKLSAASEACEAGASVEDRGECAQAAEWLHFGAVQDVPQSHQFAAPTGCYKGPDGMWYNKPLVAITAAAQSAPGVQRICRTESV